jgi:uncharacterized HAD superfamily protein|tara:strand:+ start:232 stop:552 length:321 start_codon:yes stop_codon:yes gene_type:complete
MDNLQTYCFDIDGTICTTNCEYKDAKPFNQVIKLINKLYSSGNKIILFTSRGSKSGKDWFEFTKNQINNWGIKYHKLIMGKPQADIFIDDRAINIDDWCKKNNILK